ncbi:HNH endonuclease [Xanthomonas phage Murka]|nr:HNH endonuclease [Xanthomonas phage Murka]
MHSQQRVTTGDTVVHFTGCALGFAGEVCIARKNKGELLGMSFGTARARLDRDLLFKFAVSLGHVCHRCGKDLDRDSFSVDHVTNWSVSSDPFNSFFDLDNIAFSHFECNSGFRSNTGIAHGKGGYEGGCRCDTCRAAKRAARSDYSKQARRDRYLKHGT